MLRSFQASCEEGRGRVVLMETAAKQSASLHRDPQQAGTNNLAIFANHTSSCGFAMRGIPRVSSVVFGG